MTKANVAPTFQEINTMYYCNTITTFKSKGVKVKHWGSAKDCMNFPFCETLNLLNSP